MQLKIDKGKKRKKVEFKIQIKRLCKEVDMSRRLKRDINISRF